MDTNERLKKVRYLLQIIQRLDAAEMRGTLALEIEDNITIQQLREMPPSVMASELARLALATLEHTPDETN